MKKERFEQVKKSNEEGRFSVLSCSKVTRWLFWDVGLFVMMVMTLPPRVNYFYGLLAVYILLTLSYWIALYYRSRIPRIELPPTVKPKQSEINKDGVALQSGYVAVRQQDGTVMIYYRAVMPASAVHQPIQFPPLQAQQPMEVQQSFQIGQPSQIGQPIVIQQPIEQNSPINEAAEGVPSK